MPGLRIQSRLLRRFSACTFTAFCALGTVTGCSAAGSPAAQSLLDTTALTPSLSQINAEAAYESGLTGMGSNVVVIDSGLSLEPHPALPRDRVFVPEIDGQPGGPRYRALAEVATNSHGTLVAGVIGASAHEMGTVPVGQGAEGETPVRIQGVAPAATIRAYQAISGSSTPRYIPISPQSLSRAALSLSALIPAGLFTDLANPLVNLSLGYEGGIARPEYTEALLATTAGAALLQILAPLDQAVLVWAAGNARGSAIQCVDICNRTGATPADYGSPEILAGLPAKVPALQGRWLAVAAVNPPDFPQASDERVVGTNLPRFLPGGLTFFSNACGIAKDFCLAAPGLCVLTTAAIGIDAEGERAYYPLYRPDSLCAGYGPPPEGYARASGTSFSAPLVTGALALMQEQFRGQLDSAALVSRILITADDTNRDLEDDSIANQSAPNYSDSDLYGHGLLDIAAATALVGTASLALPSGGSAALDALTPQAAAGGSAAQLLHSAMQTSLAGEELMLLDSLRAPFWVQADALLGDLLLNQTAPALLGSGQPMAGQLHSEEHSRSLFAAAGSNITALLSSDRATSLAPASPWLQLVGHQALAGGVRLADSEGEFSALWGRGFAASNSIQVQQQKPNRLFMARYQRPVAGIQLAVLAGVLQEDDSLLGLSAATVRAGDFASVTRLSGLDAKVRLGRRLALSAQWQQASTEANIPAGGLLREISGLKGSFTYLSLKHSGLLATSDQLVLNWTRSRAFASGQVRWQLPVALDGGAVQYRTLTSRLRQPGRHSVQIRYLFSAGRNGAVEFGLQRAERVDRPSEVEDTASLRWQLHF